MEREDVILWGVSLAVGVVSGVAVGLGAQGVWALLTVMIVSVPGAIAYYLLSQKRYHPLEAWFIISIFSVVPMMAVAAAVWSMFS